MRKEKFKIPTIREFLPLFDDSAEIIIQDECEFEIYHFKTKFELINGDFANYLDAHVDDMDITELKRVRFIVDRGYTDEDGNPIIITEDKDGETYIEYYEEGD